MRARHALILPSPTHVTLVFMSDIPNPPDIVSPRAGLDPYEAQYMNADGVVHYRSKVGGKWQVHAFTGIASLFIILWCAAHGSLGLGLGLGALLMLSGLFLSVIRVTISSSSVDVHFGLLGPKIPLAAIDSVEAVTHDHRSLLRWGITPLGRAQWLYTIPGDNGHAVKITWRGPKGQRRVHYIGCRDHEALAAAIRRAREEVPTPALSAGSSG